MPSDMNISAVLVSAILSLALASCAKDKQAESTGPKKDKGVDKFASGFKVGKDEQGNAKMVSDRRSDFERQRKSASNLNKDFKSKAFKSQNKQFDRKSFEGPREYQKQAFKTEKNNAFQKKSRFAALTSRFAKKDARNSQKKYSTNNYDTQTARESSVKGVESNSYRDTTDGRRSYDNFSIIDQSEYKQRSIEETKNLLGR